MCEEQVYATSSKAKRSCEDLFAAFPQTCSYSRVLVTFPGLNLLLQVPQYQLFTNFATSIKGGNTISFSWETTMKSRYNSLSPLLSFLHSYDFTFICEVESCLCPLANIWALCRSGLLPGCSWPSRTQTQVLSRFSNHLNHTFDNRITEKNKLETSLNIPFHRMLTSEIRNIFFFKTKIQSRKGQNPLKCDVTTCPLEWLKWQTVTILSAKQDVKLLECSQTAGWNVS